MKIKKRDGSLVDFNKDKIINAISKAGYVALKTKKAIADIVEKMAKKRNADCRENTRYCRK